MPDEVGRPNQTEESLDAPVHKLGCGGVELSHLYILEQNF